MHPRSSDSDKLGRGTYTAYTGKDEMQVQVAHFLQPLKMGGGLQDKVKASHPQQRNPGSGVIAARVYQIPAPSARMMWITDEEICRLAGDDGTYRHTASGVEAGSSE